MTPRLQRLYERAVKEGKRNPDVEPGTFSEKAYNRWKRDRENRVEAKKKKEKSQETKIARNKKFQFADKDTKDDFVFPELK